MTKKRKSALFYILPLIICFTNCLSIKAETLEGQVGMDNKLDPLPHNLHKGTKFDPKNLPAKGTTQNWICIPNWMAGTFHRETQTCFEKHGPTTILSRSLDDRQTGQQLDIRRQIWHHYTLPDIRTIEMPNYIEWQIITYLQPISTSQDKAVSLQRAITLDVDKKKQKIIEAEISEQMHYSTPSPSGKILVDAYIRTFDQNGKKKNSQHSQTEYFPVRPFTPINFDPQSGLDLKQDFKHYLNANQLGFLIPPD